MFGHVKRVPPPSSSRMSLLAVVCTLLLILVNCESTFPLRLNRVPSREYGEKEYYYPYDHASRNLARESELSPSTAYANAKQESRFPSLHRAASEVVSVEGPSRLTKYKNYPPVSHLEDNEQKAREIDLFRALSSLYSPPQDYRSARVLAFPRPEVENVQTYNGNTDEDGPVDENEINMNLLRAMKKTMAEKNTQRRAIKESVLESAMSEQPKMNTKSLGEPSASKRISDDHETHPARARYESNFRSSKLSFLGSISDFYFIVIVACVSSVAIFSVVGAGYCFYKVQQQNKAASEVEFPSYGIVGPACRTGSTTPPKERKINQSAQMYHYQHQKQQMISNEKNNNLPKHPIGSDIESDDENEDGEYTVYECPGLAPTGEMEVKNPLFQDDLTPMESPKAKEDKKN